MEETRSSSKKWLLVTDLDRTLTGDDGGAHAMSQLGVDLTLILSSSRPRTSVIRTLHLLPPDLRITGLITARGTEIMLHGMDQPQWTARFTGWDRRPIDHFMQRHGILPCRPELQSKYKAGYHLPADRWNAIRYRVMRLSPQSQIVTSGTADFDVLPAIAGKRKAAEWIAHTLGFDPTRVIITGDSGSQVDMFASTRMAIAVAKATSDIEAITDTHQTPHPRDHLPQPRNTSTGEI